MLVGAHNLLERESSQIRRRVQKVIVHEKYDRIKKDNHDIALVKVRRIEFSRAIQAIHLDASEFPPGTNCVVTGWGTTSIYGILHYILCPSPHRVGHIALRAIVCLSVCLSVYPVPDPKLTTEGHRKLTIGRKKP